MNIGKYNLELNLLVLLVLFNMTFPPLLFASQSKMIVGQRTILNAIVVASTCRVVIDADSMGSNYINFDTYNKSVGGDVHAKKFTLWLYEEGASIPGCSAFLVAPKASLLFGNPGQLDEGGVITIGAGDGIRIDVRSTDDEASWGGGLTAQNKQIDYPSPFASKGRLSFLAKPINISNSSAGEYRGTLSFVVSYN